MWPLSSRAGKCDFTGPGLHHALSWGMFLPAQEPTAALSVRSVMGWSEMRMSKYMAPTRGQTWYLVLSPSGWTTGLRNPPTELFWWCRLQNSSLVNSWKYKSLPDPSGQHRKDRKSWDVLLQDSEGGSASSAVFLLHLEQCKTRGGQGDDSRQPAMLHQGQLLPDQPSGLL